MADMAHGIALWDPEGRQVGPGLAFSEAYTPIRYDWGKLHVTEAAQKLYSLERRLYRQPVPETEEWEVDGWTLPPINALLLTPTELQGVAAVRGLEQTAAYPRARWIAQPYKGGLSVGVAVGSSVNGPEFSLGGKCTGRHARSEAPKREERQTRLRVISDALGEAAAMATFENLQVRSRRRDLRGLVGFIGIEAAGAAGVLLGGGAIHSDELALAPLIGGACGLLLTHRNRLRRKARDKREAHFAEGAKELWSQVSDEVYAAFVDREPPKAVGTGPSQP